MKLFIDDERDPPESETEAWWVTRTSEEALLFLEDYEGGRIPGVLREVSFDHDLGGEDTTRPVMMWMAEHNVWPDRIVIHTANRIGRDWLAGTADQYAPEESTITIDGRPYRRNYGRRY